MKSKTKNNTNTSW